jgi:hypothetical protein
MRSGRGDTVGRPEPPHVISLKVARSYWLLNRFCGIFAAEKM